MSYIDAARVRSVGLVKSIAEDKKVPPANKKLIVRYLELMKGMGLSDRTVSKNMYSFYIFLKAMGKKNVLKATKEDISRAMGIIEGTEYADKTKQAIKVTVKQFYKHFLGEGEFYPKQVRWIKTSLKAYKRLLPEDILSEEEVLKLISAAGNQRDKALVALLYDSGIRMGELLNLRIKDVNLDTSPAHITVNGKTGMRRVPIMFSTPYLANYLNNLSEKKPEEFLWSGLGTHIALDRVDYNAISQMIKRTAKAAKLRKRVYAHLFRHSRASYYANKLTEQQLKAFFGWTGDSRMAGTYVHLSGRDIDNAVMQANDVEVKTERTAPMLKVKTCQKCRFDNGIDSTYCARCGATLEIYTAVKKNEERENITNMFAEAMKDPDTADRIGRIIKGRKKKGQ